MAHKSILFTIDEYDQDGDRIDIGVFLHFGDTRVKVANSKEEFCKEIIPCFRAMVEEIEKNY